MISILYPIAIIFLCDFAVWSHTRSGTLTTRNTFSSHWSSISVTCVATCVTTCPLSSRTCGSTQERPTSPTHSLTYSVRGKLRWTSRENPWSLCDAVNAALRLSARRIWTPTWNHTGTLLRRHSMCGNRGKHPYRWWIRFYRPVCYVLVLVRTH